MFENLEDVVLRFEEIENDLAQPGLDGRDVTRLSRERSSIEELVQVYQAYRILLQAKDESKAMLEEDDAEMRSLAKEELTRVTAEIERTEKKLILLTLPQDPNDAKNVILELRAGAGGDEAAIFVGDLLRMYTKYSDKLGWKMEMLSSTTSEKGGFKEVICGIEGLKVFSRMKFESGVHRVQRVPETEAQGRVHTSTVTVAILPEAEDVEVHINPADLEITTCRASGAGGQHVNKTDSAVRMVHIPTGLVVECQDERSQIKNKAKALKVLKARLLEKAQNEQHAEISANRRSQVGTGDRSERIRTYNFPQSRLTDHRINLTLYNLPDVMDGQIEGILDALGTHHQTELLKEQALQSMAGGYAKAYT